MKTNSLDFDAQALREKILDLAMRGKLVPQDPNDEPASVLLEKIKAEKAELIKEKKIKKIKPLPPITDDEKPFDIPDSWEWVRFNDIGIMKNGKTPKKTDVKSNARYPYFKVKDMNINSLYMKIVENYVDEKYESQIFPKNTIIYPKNGGAVLTNKKRILIQDSLVDLNTGGIIPYENINFKFLFYMFQSFDIKKYVKGSAVPTINAKKLRETVVPLPPLSEQSRIAAKIAQLFALLRKVETSTRQYAKLQTLLKSKVLDLAMRGKLVPQDPNDEPASVLLEKIKAEKAELIKEKKIKKTKPLPPITDDEKPFAIPDSWEWVRLGDVLDVRDGTHGTPKYVSDGVPLVTAKNLRNGKIDFSNIKYISESDAKKINERSQVNENDVLFAMIGTIGNPVLVNTDRIFSIKNVALLKANTLINMRFVYMYILTIQDLLLKNASGGNQKFLSLRKINKLPFSLPPLPEQVKIIKMVNSLFDKGKF
ncbi:MAG: restriction endonuclease subunit S [Lactobacillus helveticus]|uniref:restriction endonuclease subunit S n=2 Tax=Lactobacillus helveticus TaxID=1587 RepID=UPI000DA6FB25|nr:restriction endonuclease subunit S [Lactobacillus helveticus]AZA19644.1 MAG: restriction endonuclease subunit S [Lactobacillus helveticus]MCT3408465.1 restriction endonuclease subunit S [Lactobacillus helveticus]NHL91241.1 restriction endonuclease subunit S [Lactobacillus helveticus]PZD77681.1 restriction endonuclease subunit S [Lactobacillus helveticus]